MSDSLGFNINHWIYDIETFKSVFTFGIIRADGKHLKVFEVSSRKNETDQILNCLRYLVTNKQSLVGFNNLGFDYPIIHRIMQDAGKAKKAGRPFTITPSYVYRLAQEQIDSFKGDGFGNTIRQEDELIRQIDLYKIHHFDNKAKATSLKMIEFNMRSETIEDLPYSPSKDLTDEEINDIVVYNSHDIIKTLDFYYKTYDMIEFREQIGQELGIDFTNHNDTKIGKDFFIKTLETIKPGTCFKMKGDKKVMNRTVRDKIVIKDCLFNYYDFERPEFIAIKKWFEEQVIQETKGVFTDIPEHRLGDVVQYANLLTKRRKIKTNAEYYELKKLYPLGWIEKEELKALENVLDEQGNPVKVQNEKGKMVNLKRPKTSTYFCYNIAQSLNVTLDGFEIVFGVGGIHASLSSTIVQAEEGYVIKDADVASMYPNIAISNRVYPEHLGEDFCDIYENVYQQRKQYPKGTPKNLALKLALNGVYGDSNNQYSPFFDSKYTMTITINGQLSLCLLGEKLLKAIPDIQFIQWNTDGLTCKFKKEDEEKYKAVCDAWQKQVKLELEFADYSKMFIRDVNNYIALYTNGKVKRKGAYEYGGLGWHQNQGGLVIPKAVEAYLVNGTPIEEFISKHEDVYDFMLRTKVPRSSKLVLEFEDGACVELQNICRYYISKSGGKLVKIMPPLPDKEDAGWRRLGIDKSWNVIPCNNMEDYRGDVDLTYYVQEAQKLASLQDITEGETDEE